MKGVTKLCPNCGTTDLKLFSDKSKKNTRCIECNRSNNENGIYITKHPERKKEKALAKIAKKRMKELCGKEVWVESKKLLKGSTKDNVKESTAKEKYGRVLGNIYQMDGTNIADVLIREGYAIKYRGKKKTHVWK